MRKCKHKAWKIETCAACKAQWDAENAELIREERAEIARYGKERTAQEIFDEERRPVPEKRNTDGPKCPVCSDGLLVLMPSNNGKGFFARCTHCHRHAEVRPTEKRAIKNFLRVFSTAASGTQRPPPQSEAPRKTEAE